MAEGFHYRDDRMQRTSDIIEQPYFRRPIVEGGDATGGDTTGGDAAGGDATGGVAFGGVFTEGVSTGGFSNGGAFRMVDFGSDWVTVAPATRHTTGSNSDLGDSEEEGSGESVCEGSEIELEQQEANSKPMTNNQPTFNEQIGLDCRLVNPKSYFTVLDNLKEDVLSRSMLEFYSLGHNDPFTAEEPYDRIISIPFPEHSSLKTCQDHDIKKLFDTANQNAKQYFTTNRLGMNRDIDQDVAYIDKLDHLFHLVESRNTILRVMANIEAMKAAAYCDQKISILIKDRVRSNVARLVPVDISKIKALAIAFETSLYRVMINPDPPPAAISHLLGNITRRCEEILPTFGLDWNSLSALDQWRYTVQILNLAAASYATAHVGDFRSESFKFESTGGFTLPGSRFEVQLFSFRPRCFQCLGEFFNGHKAWVLEPRDGSNQPDSEPELYILTQAAAFADIWGPMWGSSLGKPDPEDILRYNVGNGVILPWSLQPYEAGSHLIMQDNEVLCHWMSCADVHKMENQLRMPRQRLNSDSFMLIGAGTTLTSTDCRFSVNARKQQLRDAGLLHYRGTMAKTWYKDAESYSFQVGYSGVNAAAQRSYKLRERTCKQALVELWKNEPEGRNPRALEHWFGIEVSACTLNARRRRLVCLLGSQTMQKYLEGCSIQWLSQECRDAFFASLKSDDHTAFRKLYGDHPEWQDSLGKVISLCLDILSETGNKETAFDLFWVHGTTAMESVVTLKPSEHTWVGFLKDSRDCCTMAVVENACFKLDNLSAVRRCQKEVPTKTPTDRTYTVLKTAILVNENDVARMRKVKDQRQGSPFQYRWSVSSVNNGRTFQFGENGTLMTLDPLKKSELLMAWKSRNRLSSLVSRISATMVQHREYLFNEELETSPVDVIIISNSDESSPAQRRKETFLRSLRPPSRPTLGQT